MSASLRSTTFRNRVGLFGLIWCEKENGAKKTIFCVYGNGSRVGIERMFANVNLFILLIQIAAM